MDLGEFREYCLTKPGASEETPFGPINLKCDPDLALDLRDRYEQVRAGYHMNKKHWNTVEIESGIPDIELRKMIDHSYKLVIEGYPKFKAKIGARPRRSSTAGRRARR
jgi:predicted DNA-binding protein (MmcQ/YjbR family)